MLEFMQRKKVSRMTNEKIKEILDRCNGRFGWVQIHMDTEENYLLMPLADLVELLEKQVPEMPDYEGDEYADGEFVYDTWICPNCGRHYEVDYDDYEYCPQCGQALDLDWEVTE